MNVSDLASSETVFALVSVTFSSRALNRDRLVRRQGSAGELSAGPPQDPCTGNCCLPHYTHKLFLLSPSTSANGELCV